MANYIFGFLGRGRVGDMFGLVVNLPYLKNNVNLQDMMNRTFLIVIYK